MIKLPDIALSPQAAQKLGKYQEYLNGLASYAARVETAKKKFQQYNRESNAAFCEVRQALDQMCSGVRRCAYCEDSCADEVEHIQPKDLYPELTFVWQNYCYACGHCNGPKNNRWAVFSAVTGLLTEIQRRPGAPLLPPEAGNPAFINPRLENPLDLMKLDLGGTFYYVPVDPTDPQLVERVKYTVGVLSLNDNDLLVKVRNSAYHAYVGLQTRYISQRDKGEPQAKLDLLIQALQRYGQRTVWEEIKRQRHDIPELSDLFVKAPEALAW